MSDAAFDALDQALDTIDGVVQSIEARERAKQAAEAIEDCRFRAVGERSAARAFFTSLALGLEPGVATDERIETAAVDGKRLWFNPEWVLEQDPDELYGVVIGHEPMHCAMEHFARGQGFEDLATANIAGDLEINQICQDAGFTLPGDAIFPGRGQYKHLQPGLTMEEYYAALMKDKQEGGGDGDGPGTDDGPMDPGGSGGFLPAPDKATAEAQAGQWKGRVAAAAQEAQQRGDVGGALRGFIDRILRPKVDPWAILREFMTRVWPRASNRGPGSTAGPWPGASTCPAGTPTSWAKWS